MPKQKKEPISVDKLGENAEIKIVTDILGAGETAKSISDAYKTTVVNFDLKSLRPGIKMFLISMSIVLAAIIYIANLEIEAFKSYRFDLVLTAWFIVFIGTSLIYFWISVLDKSDKNIKNKK